MILKIMEKEPGFDNEPTKRCTFMSNVHEVSYRINEPTQEAYLEVRYKIAGQFDNVQHLILNANAYLMNDDGKTIQSFSPREKIDI